MWDPFPAPRRLKRREVFEMKKLFLSLALLGLLTLTACYGASKVGDAFEGTVNDHEGVAMTLVEGTATPGGATVEVVNATEAEIGSGNEHDFGLQMERDGQWYLLERKGEFANTAEAYIFSPDEPRELAFTWDSSYGDLKPGRYRVTKRFFEYRAPGDTTDFLLAAEFTIE